MTVAELIERLQKFPPETRVVVAVRHDVHILKRQKFPPETRVVVAGYEDGFNDVKWVEGLDIALNVHTEDYYGAHNTPDCSKANAEVVPAVLLRGHNHNAKGNS